eukprot:GAHX01005831.1.p1 GENE.GAHX01005831.1~~GAHX01005831.1.p1  ORF type:complete len:50 (+),score=7.26 GAHX01005831.1:53-202(+)
MLLQYKHEAQYNFCVLSITIVVFKVILNEIDNTLQLGNIGGNKKSSKIY